MKKEMKSDSKVKMNILEALDLFHELEGLIKTERMPGSEIEKKEVVAKGLLNENLTFSLKYKLSKNSINLKKELDFFDEQKRKIMEENSDENGKLKNIEKANKQYSELCSLEVEVELYKVPVAEMDFKTDYNYQSVFKHLIEE